MAIVKCRECRENVSDQASSCPHCGIDYPSSKSVTVTFCRELQFAGVALKLNVAVDGVGVGQLWGGRSFSIQLPTGVHSVQVWNSIASCNLNIRIENDRLINIAFANSFVAMVPQIKVW